jgi:protein-disulfide isomerase
MLMQARLAIALAFLLSASAHAASEGRDPLVRDDGRTRGSATAPITLIEYSDFTCGFCLKFFRETWPALRTRYVETGKLRFLYRDYPRSDRGPGLQAAIAARCAGEQGQYWPMHDRLFASGGRLDQAALKDHARAIGLGPAAFATCLRDERHTKAIFQDREQGMSFGFRGTPGFLLFPTDGDLQEEVLAIPGAFPYEVFEEQIERLLAAPGSKKKG